MKNRHRSYLINLIFPSFVFGSVTGILTAVVITLYKLCATQVIAVSEAGYHYLRGHLSLLPVVLGALVGLALLFAYCYKKLPNLRGGGIPTSIGILRGILPFRWLKNLVGTFCLSLISFLIGVPLGNEGPSVQMGTAIGRGCVFSLAEKHRAWDRYAMTGGASAGFSVATGAPISGIMFAIEEAHQRLSPMIVMVASTAVMFSYLTTELLARFLPISTALFPTLSLTRLSIEDVWIPVVVGGVMGLFAVLFLRYYRLISGLFNNKLKGVKPAYKILFVFVATLILGLCSFSFVSTGHELMLSLFSETTAVYILLLVLAVRSTLTLCANTNGITGGMFVPLLALGAVLSAVLGQTMESLFGLGHEYYTVILVLGITACIAGMMKMPVTAILFAVEALSCYENIVYVIVVSAVAFIITEIFDAKSINDSVLDDRIKEQRQGKTPLVIDTFVTVKKNAFAVGKQIRDIFWPANLFVLSFRHDTSHPAEVDRHGGQPIGEGDVLHVRYATCDEEQTKRELTAIVGEQTYSEKEADVI